MIRWFRRLRPAFRREDGTAAMEFVLAVPLLITIFMASFEAGLLMIRSIMLEQSVDMTMRELRLGHYTLPDTALLKTEICKRTVIFKDCQANITIEMTRITTTGWALPTTGVACIDRSEDIVPVTSFVIGQQNDLMLIRVCVVQDALFPTTGIGLGLPKDGHGGYGVISTSAFAVEPS
ncbi:TadE/TadG family type IV pilus assembly protein [Cypionkella sp.]|jgi:Flp pilus assembly protein TadG|uniref:TadE/TadG family type IV pilus assembly protein n=1 Tax=Cypionkella sp. TaxID=2811411 RepID=UPI0027175913|nr:TadE/TadG family type IV pilus assembly protein [Cypionkella sp.]MDO8985834.1 TadE/TadG family type IV pilus assembly protein [Cypionkella sp.]MDP2051248.1 TadE/TadG family type IV pilus assembly protein [Cypionkella sp.]